MKQNSDREIVRAKATENVDSKRQFKEEQ